MQEATQKRCICCRAPLSIDDKTQSVKLQDPPIQRTLLHKCLKTPERQCNVKALTITPVGFTALEKRRRKKKEGLIDPKRHFIHSAGRQPSLFSKESTLSRLHSSGASLPRPDELCRLYLPKQGSSLTGTQHFTRWFWLPADLSRDKNVSASDRIEPSVRDETSQVGFRNLQLLLKSCSRLWGLLKI